MTFSGFKETSEAEEINENKESSLDNIEKPRNQILETPDDYDDDFDSKIDSNEDDNREEFFGIQDNGEEKQKLVDRIKEFLSKNKIEISKEDTESNTTSEEMEKAERNRVERFKDSLKAPSSEESKKYNEEHGYPEVPIERPKGGFEREIDGGDPRWEDSHDSNENSDDTENDYTT